MCMQQTGFYVLDPPDVRSCRLNLFDPICDTLLCRSAIYVLQTVEYNPPRRCSMIAICGAGSGALSYALFLIESGESNVCLYEGRSEQAYHDLPSGGLGLALNGMKVLQRLGLDEQVAAGGFKCNTIELRHCYGRVIGCLPKGSGLISRKVPHRVLLEKLAEQGIIKPICAAEQSVAIKRIG